MKNKIKVVHIITSLDQGGAENSLFRLVSSTLDSNDHMVISLKSEGFYGERLNAIGVPVISLKLNTSKGKLIGILMLRQTLIRYEPQIVQTWLYHADLFGGLVARSIKGLPIVWSIRNTKVHRKSLLTQGIVQICALLSSKIPRHLISCSHVALQYHINLGYRCTADVIPNGFDVSTLIPNNQLRIDTRNSLGLADEIILGFVARWDPQKNHEFFLKLFSNWVVSKNQTIVLLLIGMGCDPDNSQLTKLLQKYKLSKYVRLLGERSNDMPALFNAIDITVLPSLSEAFPNVLAESMSCGTPCIASRVGDAEYILGSHGWLCDSDNTEQWIATLESVVDQKLDGVSWSAIQNDARAHIIKNYNIQNTSRHFVEMWKKISNQEIPQSKSNSD